MIRISFRTIGCPNHSHGTSLCEDGTDGVIIGIGEQQRIRVVVRRGAEGCHSVVTETCRGTFGYNIFTNRSSFTRTEPTPVMTAPTSWNKDGT